MNNATNAAPKTFTVNLNVGVPAVLVDQLEKTIRDLGILVEYVEAADGDEINARPETLRDRTMVVAIRESAVAGYFAAAMMRADF